MSPAEKRLGGAGGGFFPMVAQQEWTVCRSPAWSRWSALLLMALISALQHPVQGSSTLQPDESISIGEPWPPEELSSSAASELPALYGQEETENTTLFYNTTSTRKKLSDTSPTASIQDNSTIEFEELGPSESPIPSPFQPTNPGLNDTSILPLLTLHPYNAFSTGEDGFISSSMPSSSLSSSSLSFPPPYQSSLSVTDISSTTVPYLYNVTEKKDVTQDIATDILNSSSNTFHVTSSWAIIENGTTHLVNGNQTLETTQAPGHTDSALDSATEDSLRQTNNEIESSTVAVTSLETSVIQTMYALPYEPVVTPTSTKANVDSFSTSYIPSTPVHTTFTTILDTVNNSNLESHQVETHTIMESGSNFNTATYVPMTQEKSSSFTTEQASKGLIESSSNYFTDTTATPRPEETSVEATNSSFELSPSPNVMMSTVSVTTSTLLNPSTTFISVPPSDNTDASLSDGLSTVIYNTDDSMSRSTNLSTVIYSTDSNTDDAMSKSTNLLTSSVHSQRVTDVTTSSAPTQSDERTSQVTISVGPSTNRSFTTAEERHDDMISWTSMAPSEIPSEVSLSFKPSTVAYRTNTITERLQTGHTVDSSHILTNNQREENTIFSSTGLTSSTFEDSTFDFAISTTELSEVASSVKTTPLTISLDATSDTASWTSTEIVNVTSPLETKTSTTFYSRSGETLASETPPEISTFAMINNTSTTTEVLQTGEVTYIATSSQENSSSMLTVPEPITLSLSTLATALESTSNLDGSRMTTQTVTDNNSTILDITSPSKVSISPVMVSSQSATTSGSETLTSSWVSSATQESSTSINNMETNSIPYSSYTATSINDTTFRPTVLQFSTTHQSSPVSTSELSTYTNSGQSSSNIAGVSEVTSPLELRTRSTVTTPSNDVTLSTITDYTIETVTSTLPITVNISTTMLSSLSTNINTRTETLSKSTTWDISSPQHLSNGVTPPLVSMLTQPSVSAMEYTSSATLITTASNTTSHDTIMLSSSRSTDSSTLSTGQGPSRNSEYQTSLHGLQSTTTDSPSTVTSLLSLPATQTEPSVATTVDMVISSENTTHREDTTRAILHTTSHLSPTTIESTHSSSFSHPTTTNFPTIISDSLSTVSSVVSSAEASTVSTTGNATQNFTSTEKPSPFSSVTLTIPSTHASPSIIYTLLSTQFTKKAQTPTLAGVTTGSTPRNHTTHTPTTVVLPTTLQTTTFTSHPSTITHAPRTDIITTVSDTTKVPTLRPRTITSSTMASTATTLRTSVAPVTPATNATVVNSTALTTALSTSTTPSSFECKLSSETMVKTVLTLMNPPPTAQKEIIVQRFEEFLNLTLYRALNQSIQIFVNRTSLNSTSQPLNVTVGYSVSVNSSVYIPSAVVDVLRGNDVFNLTELKRRIPTLHAVPIKAETWQPAPDISFRVKTVLKLMGSGANVHTCVYAANMERRLQTAFERAELTSTGVSGSNLSVQILSTSKNKQILTLIYVVRNNSNALNGTTASSLLNVLSGEVVGYYLGDPPSIIAEPLYYPNIDISTSTMNYWVYTVIQGVDSQSLGPNNQSFSQQMEERLAKLFQISSQQSRRFRRATNIGSYTVQMVKMQRLDGPNNLAELTYYALRDGQPILGTVAAKQLSTIDPQTMALTLGHIVRVQANSVVQKPPNNLWIIAAVLAPIAVVTVIIIIITAVLCRKNKSDFKSDNISNLPPRTKPVQGFDYAKQHLGQQGGDEEMLPVTQETVVPSLNLSQERDSTKDGSTEKMLKSSDNRKSRSPCENGSVISNESEDASSDRSTPQKVMAQHRATKDEACKRNVPISDEEEGNIRFDKNKMISDPFDSSSGSVQLIAIKPVSIPPALTVSERNQEMSIINGEVNKALKQKSDIEHYRNKLRLKAKRKGYYDFPPIESKSLNDRKRKAYSKTQMEINNALDAGTDTSSPFAEPKNRQSSMKNHPYRSRQSLNSPSPGETEMDLLVTRERPRRGIRNSGYDTEPEIIEETNIDRVKQARTYIKSRQGKGHSETSTLSSQPSIDEVRQQMHMLLEEAFSLASAGHGGPKRQADPYASVQHMPYSEVVTSAPGTMSRPRMQWVPTYGPEVYQYSLPRPNYRFSQLPEMVIGSPPPPVPPRTGPVAVPSLRRSTSDMANKSRMPEPGGNDQGPGNSMPAVFAIPGNRAGYSGYYIPQPPASYRNQAWMSYSGENDLPGQWADSVPLPGYIEAYPRSRYPQNSPSRLPRQFGQPVNLHPSLDHATGPSIGASQQSLADTDTPDASITNLSTAALVKAIREEVAKLAKKQTDMFEFQV
ncbi:UPF0606 protein KIAA1549L homolog isoform X2 [Eleutherodactylus coqui]|uniref:UPF0606 protein KIAA1549L homolog isoform X2 n=1 Tax=Eleutherodactylus coqui TaxID=57060 RepID=UPI0034623842